MKRNLFSLITSLKDFMSVSKEIELSKKYVDYYFLNVKDYAKEYQTDKGKNKSTELQKVFQASL